MRSDRLEIDQAQAVVTAVAEQIELVLAAELVDPERGEIALFALPEIRVGGVTSTTNPLDGRYGLANDGVQAYFEMVNSEGGIYGTEKTLRNLGPFSFPLRTHIRGLYQCGASTLAAGINGVTKSGLAAAAAALDCEPEELLSATGQSLQILPAEDPSCWPEALRPTITAASASTR